MQIESKLHSFKLGPDESFKLMSYRSLLSQRAKICNCGLLDNLAKYLFIFLFKALNNTWQASWIIQSGTN